METEANKIIVFVNGFSEVERSWTNIFELLESYYDASSGISLLFYDCSDKWRKEWINQKSFSKIYENFFKWFESQDFYSKLCSKNSSNGELYFVCCGLGSLVVLNYLKKKIG